MPWHKENKSSVCRRSKIECPMAQYGHSLRNLPGTHNATEKIIFFNPLERDKAFLQWKILKTGNNTTQIIKWNTQTSLSHTNRYDLLPWEPPSSNALHSHHNFSSPVHKNIQHLSFLNLTLPSSIVQCSKGIKMFHDNI